VTTKTKVGRAWVRDVDGRLVLTWLVEERPGEWRRGERPLTVRERIAWRAAAKIPRP
jgi:hypothetical protein